MVVGDLNIWHTRWLIHSPADTLEGEQMHTICKDHGLKQLVTEPTRRSNLLDLVLSSLHGSISTKVLPRISDHKSICVRIDLPAPHDDVVEGVVWNFK